MNAKKNKEDQQAIQKLMEQLKDCVSVYEHEIGVEPVIFIKNEGNIWTLKFNNQSFRLNISVE